MSKPRDDPRPSDISTSPRPPPLSDTNKHHSASSFERDTFLCPAHDRPTYLKCLAGQADRCPVLLGTCGDRCLRLSPALTGAAQFHGPRRSADIPRLPTPHCTHESPASTPHSRLMSTTTQPTLEGDRSAEAAESETMENNQSPEGSSPTSSAANSVEESERPVRHQLKKTSITTDAEVGATADATKNRSSKETSSVAQADVEKVAPAVERSQERPKKKRSFDEVASDAIEGESTTTSSKHVRKRSRSEDSDSAPDEEDAEAAPADEAEAEDDDDNEDAEESVIPPPEKGNTQSEDEHAPSDAENGPTPASPPAETLPAESSEEVPTLEEPTTPPPQPSLPSSAAPLKSPPNKRSRDQFVTEQETERLSKKSTLSSAPGTVDAPVLAPATEPASTIPEPEKVPREEPVVGETKPETSEPLKVCLSGVLVSILIC